MEFRNDVSLNTTLYTKGVECVKLFLDHFRCALNGAICTLESQLPFLSIRMKRLGYSLNALIEQSSDFRNRKGTPTECCRLCWGLA
jgi:hypothetical protein